MYSMFEEFYQTTNYKVKFKVDTYWAHTPLRMRYYVASQRVGTLVNTPCRCVNECTKSVFSSICRYVVTWVELELGE